MKRIPIIVFVTLLMAGSAGAGETAEAIMYLLTDTGLGEPIGKIRAEDGPYGVVVYPMLRGLTPGLHGFHVHENPDCGPAEKDGGMVPGLAAGGHYDPANTEQHLGPYGNGHLGDLPVLYTNSKGVATQALLAPRIKVSDLRGRSLMIHAGGDNYLDKPRKLGGGGARVVCGVVK